MLEKESLSNQMNNFSRKGGEEAIKMTENLETLSIEELRQTIHELRVHQIELEESEARLDQKTLWLQAWSTRTVNEFCNAEGKGAHYAIDQAGVWVDCVRQGKPVIHNDYSSLSHKKGLPPGHAPVIRGLVVPILRSNQIVAILGIGNKAINYTEKDVEIVSFLADVAWEITSRKRQEEELKRSREQFMLAINGSQDGIWDWDLSR